MKEQEVNKRAQPGLFDPKEDLDAADVVRYALGDFQDRGFALAGRELALDRLLGALHRSYAAFDVIALDDEAVASQLRDLGATVTKLHGFVAKHPFRVIVHQELAAESLEYYRSFNED